MDDKPFGGTVGNFYDNSERKYPNEHRDVKRKLSFISKKIGDFQRQRKFTYKNSAKVKRVIHNQVNQIVKCFRARERTLCADVDEAYIAQEEYISEELSMLQSVHIRSQTLLEHLDGNREAVDLLNNVYAFLSKIKYGEKQDVKALELISDFEAMKSMANAFGHLEGDFVKKEEFVFINKCENNTSSPVCQEFHDKNECPKKPLSIMENEDSKTENSDLTESEDTFEIVDLLDSMCCEDTVKDSVMVTQKNCSDQKDLVEHSFRSRSKIPRTSNDISQKTLKCSDFNPEEEWKQIFEMRNRIANIAGISKLAGENKNCEIQNTISNCSNTSQYFDRNCKRNTYLQSEEIDNWLCNKRSRKEKHDENNKQKISFLKEADVWLYNRNLEKDGLSKENILERSTKPNSDTSPVELIRQAFSPYLIKDNINNWLFYN